MSLTRGFVTTEGEIVRGRCKEMWLFKNERITSGFFLSFMGGSIRNSKGGRKSNEITWHQMGRGDVEGLVSIGSPRKVY